MSRQDNAALTGQRIGTTPRMDKAFNECGTTPRMNWQASQCYEEGCRLERELNQAIRERDQARSNVKPMGAVTIARNGYIEEIEAQRDQAIKERDRAQASLRTLIALHEREIETGQQISGEVWEIAGYALTDK